MLRTRKAIALAIVTLVMAGCTQSDRATSGARYPKFRSSQESSARKARPQPPPQILPQTHFAAGTLFETQGQVGKAIDQYRKAIAVNHNYVGAYHRLGRLLSSIGHHTEAADALSHAVDLKPDNAILRNNFGYELMFENQWDDAEGQLRRAIALKPDMARAHINLGLVLSRAGRFDEALASFSAVLPEADAYYNLGLMFRGQGRIEQAAEAFRHVLEVHDDFPAAATQLEQVSKVIEKAASIKTPVQTGHPEHRIADQPIVETASVETTKLQVPLPVPPEDIITPLDILEKVDAMIASSKFSHGDERIERKVRTAEPEPDDDKTTVEKIAISRITQPVRNEKKVPKPIVVAETTGETATVETVTAPKTKKTDPIETSGWAALTEFLADSETNQTPDVEEPIRTDAPTHVAETIEPFEPKTVAAAGRVETPTPAEPMQIADQPDPLIEWDGETVDATGLREILDNETRCFEQMEIVPSIEATVDATHPESTPPVKQTAATLADQDGSIGTTTTKEIDARTTALATVDTPETLGSTRSEIQKKLNQEITAKLPAIEETIRTSKQTARIAMHGDRRPTVNPFTLREWQLIGPPYEPTTDTTVAKAVSTTIDTAIADRVEKLATRVRSFDTAAALAELEGKLAIVRNEIDCLREKDVDLEATHTARPTMSATVAVMGSPAALAQNREETTLKRFARLQRRPTMSATVKLMGPPAGLAQNREELTLKKMAPIQRRPTMSATIDWRASFAGLDTLLSITRNDVLCRRAFDAETDAAIADISNIERRDPNTSASEIPLSTGRVFGAPTLHPQRPPAK